MISGQIIACLERVLVELPCLLMRDGNNNIYCFYKEINYWSIKKKHKKDKGLAVDTVKSLIRSLTVRKGFARKAGAKHSFRWHLWYRPEVYRPHLLQPWYTKWYRG